MRFGTSQMATCKKGTEQVSKIYLGTSVAWSSVAPGSQTFTANGTFTVPADCYSVNLCMVGAGGAGDNIWGNQLGGNPGTVVSQSVSVTPAENVTIVIGQGATFSAGGNTSFGAIVANGGAAQLYSGNGALQVTCGGSANDGIAYNVDPYGTLWGGGSSGFGNGGSASSTANGVGQTGGVGSGGGSAGDETGGAGGRGEVRLTWG